jgi:hypothetical protein
MRILPSLSNSGSFVPTISRKIAIQQSSAGALKDENDKLADQFPTRHPYGLYFHILEPCPDGCPSIGFPDVKLHLICFEP